MNSELLRLCIYHAFMLKVSFIFQKVNPNRFDRIAGISYPN